MILILDTTAQKLIKLSLCRDDACDSQEIPFDKGQSEDLLPAIDKLLQSAAVTVHDLRAIAVHVGPGSYTGVRIGITVANTLAWLLDIPIIGFDKGAPADIAMTARAAINNHPGFQKPVIPRYPTK